MAIIHEMLYQTKDISQIDFKKYVERLLDTIESGYSLRSQEIKKTINVENILFNIDTIIPLGLILNELISNAYKYAFSPDIGDELIISIEKLSSEFWILSVNDNGAGIDDFDKKISSSSFGLKLVKMLSRQLRGKFEYKNEEGSTFYIKFRELN